MSDSITNSTSTEKHPKGLYLLFFTEMWERFSYYGMRAIFTLYMIKALLYDKSLASNIFGSYTGLVYLTPLIGGYISDRYFGNRRSILTGGIMMAIGQFMLFFSGMFTGTTDTTFMHLFFYSGLTLLIFGNGFFKPNISTMVGQLYAPGDKRVDSAFTIFYMGINLGAFFSPLICGGLGDTGNPADFKWGFFAAGVGMIISIISFELLKNKYLISPDGKPLGMPIKKSELKAGDNTIPEFQKSQILKWLGILVVLFIVFFKVVNLDLIGSIIFSAAIAIPGMIISDKSLTKIESQRIWVIFILAFFVIFFWSAFEQAGASLTFFAEEQTDRDLLGWSVPASWFQSINPVGIIVFAPILTIVWLKLGKRNNEPSSPLKMSMGLLFLSLGYVVIAFGVNGVGPNVKVSILWLTTMYLLHTFGELCLSPIGLSMVAKLAPIRFSSLLMGTWFLANAAANKLAGTLSSLYPTPDNIPVLLGYHITNLYDFFVIFIVMSAIASLILYFIYRKLQDMMHGVH